jgi:PAS domain S-box-containing protein
MARMKGEASNEVVEALADLLTDVPHVMFCVKRTDGRYISVNQAFADRAGRSSPAAIVGLRAADLFPPELAERYERQDAKVIASGRALRNELELILRPNGSVGWYVTSKTLVGDRTEPTAIASVSVDLRASVDSSTTHRSVALAVHIARNRATEQMTVGELAAAAGLSASQLERALKRSLGLSAKQLMVRMRLEEAINRLRTSDEPVAKIAVGCGYYDQSALTRQFRRVVGIGPAQYRASLPGR